MCFYNVCMENPEPSKECKQPIKQKIRTYNNYTCPEFQAPHEEKGLHGCWEYIANAHQSDTLKQCRFKW